MPNVIYTEEWISQPPLDCGIDAENDIGAKVIEAWSGASPFPVVNRIRSGTVNNNAIATTQGLGGHAKAVGTTVSGMEYFHPPFTMFCRVFFKSIQGAGAYVIAGFASTTGDAVEFTNTPYLFSAQILRNYSGVGMNSSAIVPVANEWFDLVWRSNSNTSHEFIIYRHSTGETEVITSSTDTSAISFQDLPSPRLGNYPYSAVPLFSIFGGNLSDAQLSRMRKNPWQIFNPQLSYVYLPSAGGGIYSLSDSGSGSDAISISVAFGLSDTGAGDDLQPLPGAELTLLDDGASADAVSLAALLAVTDTGAGSDANTVSVAFALADSGSGADAILTLTQLLVSVSDAVSGVDGVSIQTQIALADSASGADTPVLYVSLSVADTASAVDTLDVLQQLLISVTDAGSGVEGMAIAISVPVGDAGSGMDATAIQAWLALVESATGMDASVAFAAGQRIATILFKLAHRAMTFTLAARQISFTLN